VRTRPRWRELPAAQQPNCDGVALREVARALADVPPLVVPSEVDQRRERLAGCGEPLLLHLDPAQAIVGLAKQLDADLVDVGKEGMQGAKRFVVGSVPNPVAHNAPCVVLVVKTC
jgi:nucleotide-binding universal stress UspA family protein